MKKTILTITIICLVVILMSACGGGRSAGQMTAVMGAGSMGGTSHATFSMIATQIQKHSDLIVTVQASGGSSENARLIRQGEYQFGMLNSAMIVYALKGETEFRSDGPDPNIRFVANLYPSAAQAIVRKDSNIHTFSDLRGRVFSGGSPGSGDLVAFEEILNFFGVTTRDLDWRPLSNTERVAGFKDRIIHSGGWVTSVPAGNILEIAAGTPLRVLSLGNRVDEFLTKFPYYTKFVVPKGIYNGVDEDVTTVAVGIIIASRADVSDDMVYTFLKGMYAGLDELQQVHGMAHYITIESALDGSGSVPVHPGAQRYFREVGLIR